MASGGAYSRFMPGYWDGETGKRIRRAGADAQLLGVYLFTCRASLGGLGLYRLAFPMLTHELALSEDRIVAALGALDEIGFVHYDRESEEVLVPSMASWQFGENLRNVDGRHSWVVKQLVAMRRMKFFARLYERYRVPFNLPDLSEGAPPPPPPPRHVPTRKSSVRAKKKSERAPETGNPERATWLTPYAEAWKEEMGGTLPYGKSLRPLSIVRKAHGDDLCLKVWRWYLGEQGKFSSAAQFEQRFGVWREKYEAAESERPPEPLEFAWSCKCGVVHVTKDFYIGMPCPNADKEPTTA